MQTLGSQTTSWQKISRRRISRESRNRRNSLHRSNIVGGFARRRVVVPLGVGGAVVLHRHVALPVVHGRDEEGDAEALLQLRAGEDLVEHGHAREQEDEADHLHEELLHLELLPARVGLGRADDERDGPDEERSQRV